MKFNAWITKFALTTGIEQGVVEECFETSPTMVVKRIEGSPSTYFHNREWHRTKSAAIERAEEMREKRILSLNKQLTKLAGLNFRL